MKNIYLAHITKNEASFYDLVRAESMEEAREKVQNHYGNFYRNSEIEISEPIE